MRLWRATKLWRAWGAALAVMAAVGTTGAGAGCGDDSPATTADTGTDTDTDTAAGDADDDATDAEDTADASAGDDDGASADAGTDAANTDAGTDASADTAPDTEPGIDPSKWTLGTVTGTCGDGLVATVPTGAGDLTVVRLQGSHAEMGRQFGCLLGQKVADMWWVFMARVAAGLDELDSAEAADLIMGGLLDQAWDLYKPYVPQPYLDELDAMTQGAAEAGVPDDVGRIVRRGLTILEVSQTGAFNDGVTSLAAFLQTGVSDELAAYYAAQTADAGAQVGPHRARRWRPVMSTCSYFAAWGDRTKDGHLLASRVLDWDRDMGLADYKLVTVYVPDGGARYATVGYMGVPMAGLSENGLAVGAVGSWSVLERLNSASGLITMREVLEHATDFESALAYVTNTAPDGFNRPTSIGGNVMVAWGDPAGGGAQAQAAAIERNGGFNGVFHQGPAPACQPEAALYSYAEDGTLAQVQTHADAPDVVNTEADAVEVDKDGKPRLFAVDADGNFVPEGGTFQEDPAGQPMPVGKPMTCALFRGDEAMSYGVRRWQHAANGPWNGDGAGVMSTSGSYTGRYLVMHDMLEAYASGTAYQGEDLGDGQPAVPDNGGAATPLTLDEGVQVARQAAMSSNILAVVYDATALKLRVSYETGTGDAWKPASQSPFMSLDLTELIKPL